MAHTDFLPHQGALRLIKPSARDTNECASVCHVKQVPDEPFFPKSAPNGGKPAKHRADFCKAFSNGARCWAPAQNPTCPWPINPTNYQVIRQQVNKSSC